jgi:hypothetical protein
MKQAAFRRTQFRDSDGEEYIVSGYQKGPYILISWLDSRRKSDVIIGITSKSAPRLVRAIEYVMGKGKNKKQEAKT